MNKAINENHLNVRVECVRDNEPLFLNPNSDFIQTLMSVYKEYCRIYHLPENKNEHRFEIGAHFFRKLDAHAVFPHFLNKKIPLISQRDFY